MYQQDTLKRESLEYLRSLSEKSRYLIYNYTRDSSAINRAAAENNLFLENDGFELNMDKRLKFLSLQSILLNAPLAEPKWPLYNFYMKGFKVPVPAIGSLRFFETENIDIGRTYYNIIFSSTTINQDVLPYMKDFATVDGDQICCVRKIYIPERFPLLYIPSISAYPWQEEVILPVGISTKLAQQYVDSLEFQESTKECLEMKLGADGKEEYRPNPACLASSPKKFYNVGLRDVLVNNIFLGRYHVDNLNKKLSHSSDPIREAMVISTIMSVVAADQGQSSKDIVNTIYAGPDSLVSKRAKDIVDGMLENRYSHLEEHFVTELRFLRSIMLRIRERNEDLVDDPENLEVNILGKRVSFEALFDRIESSHKPENITISGRRINDIDRGDVHISDVRSNVSLLFKERARYKKSSAGYYTTIKFLSEVYDTTGTINSLCDYFADEGFLRDPTRYFDDYWAIVTCFLPLLPNHFAALFGVLIPCLLRDL